MPRILILTSLLCIVFGAPATGSVQVSHPFAPSDEAIVRALAEYLRDSKVRLSPMGAHPDPTPLENRRVTVDPRYARRQYQGIQERFGDRMPMSVVETFAEVLGADIREYDEVMHCEDPDRSPSTCTLRETDALLWTTRPSVTGDEAILWLNVMLLNSPESRWPFTIRQREIRLARSGGAWRVVSDRTVAVGGE